MTTVRVLFRCKNKYHHLKVPKRNINKTEFMRTLASKYNTSLSNVYKIINSSKAIILDANLKEKTEIYFYKLKSKRRARKLSNNSKLLKAKYFIEKHENIKGSYKLIYKNLTNAGILSPKARRKTKKDYAQKNYY